MFRRMRAGTVGALTILAACGSASAFSGVPSLEPGGGARLGPAAGPPPPGPAFAEASGDRPGGGACCA